MFEKVNPSHPDKIADRIAGALVDMAYASETNPRIAVEVLIGHGSCKIIAETSVPLDDDAVAKAVERIAGNVHVEYEQYPQDEFLAKNQSRGRRCGDNGIFKGVPTTNEQKRLSRLMRYLYAQYPFDGKAVADGQSLILCQSNADVNELMPHCAGYTEIKVNPLGAWTGGTDVDTGATNRKLGSDMGDAVTGGGIHGKDLSKADVSVNVCAHILAQKYNHEVTASCAIGDSHIMFELDGEYLPAMSYDDVVDMASEYIERLGGFERLAEWGLV